jgi:hypothetical protein
MRDAIEAVADQLLSGNAPIQKPYDVTWYRHTLAANQGLKKWPFTSDADRLFALLALAWTNLIGSHRIARSGSSP